MGSTTLVIGGCRSGKSRHALELAESLAPSARCYVATCRPLDEEMQQRVWRHQRERDPSWYTVEEGYDLKSALPAQNTKAQVILLDCITLWLTNLILDNRTEKQIEQEVDALTHALAPLTCPLIMVSNEVGTGIVPENKLSRTFRDIAGLVNQRFAAWVDTVIWMVAGIPVMVKESRPQ